VRAFFDQYNRVRDSIGLTGLLYGPYASLHRRLYMNAVKDTDTIVAISNVVQRRVKKYLGRDSAVIYPPVDVEGFRYVEDGDFWLSVNRLYPENRIEIQVEAFRRMPDEQLVIVGGYGKGDHSERYAKRIMQSLPPNVTVVSNVDDAALKDYYGRCRGLIATAADEDFGLNAVEAMAAGKPVIAVREGGYVESVIDEATGLLIRSDEGALRDAVGRLSGDAARYREACLSQSRRFDASVFCQAMGRLVEKEGL
jgi:glycosyltransferase involved in cell wall biosynthesis